MPVTAYLGPEGTFAEQAAREMVPGNELRPVASVHAAIDAVRAGEAETACVPVENSVEGSVPATLDAMSEDEPVVAVAETLLPIRFSVLVRPGVDAAAVRSVASHPHAIAQVRCWLRTHLPGAEVLPSASTSAAAVAVLEGGVDAAICAPVAAQRYPLSELAGGIHDRSDAETRFLLLRRPGAVPPPTGADRTSLAVITEDRPGALLEVLAEFALRGINLTRIESRPVKSRIGQYRFFLDCAGHVAQDAVGDALAQLHRRCTWVRFLGSYRRADPARCGGSPGNGGYAAARDWVAEVRAGRGA